MNLFRYTLSCFSLFFAVQLCAQFSIFNTQNPDVPYRFSSNSDGTYYARGAGVVGGAYYFTRDTEYGSYSEESYDVGAYSGNFKIASGQQYQRLAIAFLDGQSLRLERIRMDGTVDDFFTYDFPATSSVTLTGMASYNETQAVGAFYISGLETFANGDQVLFTLKYDEDLVFQWRTDVPVDDSVEEVYTVEQLFQNLYHGIILAYVQPTDLSVQVLRINQEGDLVWEATIIDNAPSAATISRFYGYSDKIHLYGNLANADGVSTDYFAYVFDTENGTPLLEKTTVFTPNSSAEESALQVQVVHQLVGPYSNGAYVEAGRSFRNNPNGQLYLTKKTPDGHTIWYKEYDHFPELSYINQNGYICGKLDNQGWFGYFHPFYGDLERRNESCSNSVNLAANACVTMSSQAIGEAAAQAIDGLVNNSGAATVEEYRPWMILDLGAIYWIDSIKIYPSNNPDFPLVNTRVYADLNEIPADVTRAHMTVDFEQGFYTIPPTGPVVLSNSLNQTLGQFPSRYFSLHKLGFGTLAIEEIEIFGCEIADCEDNDGDGVCLFEDCDDFNVLVPALPGTPCDDGNPLTSNDKIQRDHCTCLGGSPDIDYDNDGVPSSEDCDDYGDINCSHFLRYRPSYNHGVLDETTCECVTELQPLGCNLNYSIDGSTLTLYGIEDDGQTGFNLFDANWNIIFSCDATNCNQSVLEIANLADGDYFLNIQIFNQSNCSIEETITIDQDACADFDGDGLCNIDDPAPNDGNLPTTPGTPCNDCNTNTNNDVIQADGYTCSGTLVACPDADEDGICEDEDCDDNDPNIPTTPGTACDDGNADTQNDVIQADGCSCLGEIIPCPDADEDGICEDEDCDDNNPNIPTTPGTACDDGNADTQNDVIQADGCSCLGEMPCPDVDNDGVCADDDCDDTNPNLPTVPGTPCNDDDFTTTNDVIQADGCTCLGNPVIATGPSDLFTSGLWGGDDRSVVNPSSKEFISFKLFPNPADHHLTMLFSSETEVLEEVIIYNNNGQAALRFSQETVIGMNTLKMDISSLSDGVYFVQLRNAAVTERLVKL